MLYDPWGVSPLVEDTEKPSSGLSRFELDQGLDHENTDLFQDVERPRQPAQAPSTTFAADATTDTAVGLNKFQEQELAHKKRLEKMQQEKELKSNQLFNPKKVSHARILKLREMADAESSMQALLGIKEHSNIDAVDENEGDGDDETEEEVGFSDEDDEDDEMRSDENDDDNEEIDDGEGRGLNTLMDQAYEQSPEFSQSSHPPLNRQPPGYLHQQFALHQSQLPPSNASSSHPYCKPLNSVDLPLIDRWVCPLGYPNFKDIPCSVEPPSTRRWVDPLGFPDFGDLPYPVQPLSIDRWVDPLGHPDFKNVPFSVQPPRPTVRTSPSDFQGTNNGTVDTELPPPLGSKTSGFNVPSIQNPRTFGHNVHLDSFAQSPYQTPSASSRQTPGPGNAQNPRGLPSSYHQSHGPSQSPYDPQGMVPGHIRSGSKGSSWPDCKNEPGFEEELDEEPEEEDMMEYEEYEEREESHEDQEELDPEMNWESDGYLGDTDGS